MHNILYFNFFPLSINFYKFFHFSLIFYFHFNNFWIRSYFIARETISIMSILKLIYVSSKYERHEKIHENFKPIRVCEGLWHVWVVIPCARCFSIYLHNKKNRKIRFTWIHGCWFFFLSLFRCFFDSFHSLIQLFSSSLFGCVANIIARMTHTKAVGSMKGKGYNFWILFSRFHALGELQSIDLSLFLIGGCRQTVSSCFLFPCNSILSTEVTVLISINPKKIYRWTHFPCAFFFMSCKSLWNRLGPFLQQLSGRENDIMFV